MAWAMVRDGAATTRRWLVRHRWRMVHAARITAAGITAFGLVDVLGLSEGLWAVITAVVVTQSSVGSSLKAVFDQIVGSLFGAAFGAAVALMIMPETKFSSAVALVLALVPLSILAACSPGFRIAPVTAAIILLGGVGLEIGPLGLAVSRVVEVVLGCGVGLLVSIFLIPFQASRSVVETTAQIADLLAEQLDVLAFGGTAGQAHLASLAVRTRQKLNDLEVLVEEAARERRSVPPAVGGTPGCSLRGESRG